MEECMRTLRTLKPGQWGTQGLLACHGPSLLCVLYRYDEDSHGSRLPGGWAAVAATRKVALRIGLRERDLQRRVKSAGGRWDPDRRVWFVRRDVAQRLDLLGRVVGGGV